MGQPRRMSLAHERPAVSRHRRSLLVAVATGEWLIHCSTARQRRIAHYWLTIVWFTFGLALWIVLRHALWFVGFMSLYAIWVTHLAGWAAETPVEDEEC